MQGYYPGEVNQNAPPSDNGFANVNYNNNPHQNQQLNPQFVYNHNQQPNQQFVPNPNMNYNNNHNNFNMNPNPHMNFQQSKNKFFLYC